MCGIELQCLLLTTSAQLVAWDAKASAFVRAGAHYWLGSPRQLDVKGAKTEAEAPATVQQAAPPLTTLRNITKTPVAAKRAAPPAKAKPQHPPEVEGVKAPLPAAKKGRKARSSCLAPAPQRPSATQSVPHRSLECE